MSGDYLLQIPKEILEAVESINLPSMPQALLRFLQAVDDEHASMRELATLVGQNPSLCARLLTVANSVAMRRDREIKSLEQCLITLGTRLVRTLAACLAIQSVFARAVGEAEYDYSGFWRHSLQVAELSRLLSARLGRDDQEEAYLAGLLHDVGQLMLLGGVGERYGALLVCSSDETALRAIEIPVLGTDHAAVGAWLVDQWDLSSFMADAILFHHNGAAEIHTADSLSQIVWSAHVLSENLGASSTPAQEPVAEVEAARDLLGVELTQLTELAGQAAADVALLAEAFNIAPADDSRTHPCSSISFDQAGIGRSESHAQARLEAVVRDMALMQSLQHNLNDNADEAELLVAVRESARILFGLQKVAFLLTDRKDNLLSAPDLPGQPPLLRRFQIRLDPDQSLVAAAACGDMPQTTFGEHLPGDVSLMDVQISRAMSSEGVLYLPLCGREGTAGAIVCGLSGAQYERIMGRLSWMSSFARLAALSLGSLREIRRRQRRSDDMDNGFEQQVRKFVHEAGNPLTIIKSYLKIISQKQPADSDIAHELEVLGEEIDRVVNIIQCLKTPGQVAAFSRDTVDLAAVVEGMLALYGEALFQDRGIVLEKDLPSSLVPVLGDRDSIKQILLNLWKNASEALASGATLSISARDGVCRSGRSFIELRLADSGPGLPADVLQNLFKPLNPHRRPGHSGLGLSIVHELVNRLGGQISCQSNDEGTVFTIFLPQQAVSAP